MTRNKISYCPAQGTNDPSFNDLVFFSFHSVYPTTIQANNFIASEVGLTLLLSIFGFSDLYHTCNQTESWVFVLGFDGGCKMDLWICMVLLGRIFRHASWLSSKGGVSKAATIDLPSFGGIHEEYELNRFFFFFESMDKISLFLYSGC